MGSRVNWAVQNLLRRRRELERQLATVDRELQPLCAMSTRAGVLSEVRTGLTRELADIRTRIAALRGELPRPLSASWGRRR
jgi:type II secretory pathway component PulJ